MLFPSKHLKVAESIWGLGAIILELINQPKDLDTIWKEFSFTNDTDDFPAKHSYDNVLLAIDFLYSIGLVKLTEEGFLIKNEAC